MKQKYRDSSHRRNYKYTKKNEWINGRKDNFFTKTPGSHPEEKFGLEAKDPTPKTNLIMERRIPPSREIRSKSPGSHPEGNLGWENKMEKKSEVDLGQKKLTSAKKS